MGSLAGGKCACWDTIPCNCFRQRERDERARVRQVDEGLRLLREQNERLRQQVQHLRRMESCPD